MTSTIRIAAALTLVALVAACDPSGPDVGPPAAIQKGTVPPGATVGQPLDLSITVRDDDDQAVEGQTVTWTPSAGSTSPESGPTDAQGRASTTWTLGTTAGTQTLVAAVGGLDATFTIDVNPDALFQIAITPEDTTLQSVGDTLVMTASAEDQYGNAVTAPGLAWSSSDTAVASVSGGTVVSRSDGTVDITVAQGAVSGQTTLTVNQVVTGIGVTPDSPVMVVGESLDATARAVDARGSTVDTALTVGWTSSNTAVATVSGTGTVDAVAAGTAVITATAGTFMGESTVEVKTGPRPAITSISPAVLGAGDTATITGTDFGTDPGVVQVTVGGAPTTLLTSSDTQLTVEMPGPGVFPCAPTGDRDVIVSVDGLEATQSHPVAGAPQHSLGVGGSVALFGADVACSELTQSGDYVISVFNAAPSPVSTTSFRLQGQAATSPMAPRTLRSIDTRVRQPTVERDPELEGHLRMLEANRRLVETLGAPELAPAGPRTAAQEVGDIRTFRIPDIEGSNLCTDYIQVTAKAVYSGTYGVIWEDTLAPAAGQMDAAWSDVGTEYDQVMHQVLLDYFGDPLVIDAQLDANGLFFMLFSETVNDFQSPAINGFVFSGDFYTRSQCPSSNQGEIFYGRVPTSAATGYGSGEIGDWAWRMRSTVIHEVKHLTAYANKFDVSFSNPNLEETGLEEATARLAEEFFGRALQGYDQFDNVGYDASIWCERRVNDPSCGGVPLIMHKHYSGINEYLKAPELRSPFGSVDDIESSFYGSGWQWVRWVIDQAGIPEAQFIKPLIREPSLIGPANLADKAGRAIQELLADYTLAFAVDDHPSGFTPVRSELTMPSWDTRDIFQGLYDDYLGTELESIYPTPWPLEPHQVGGDFQTTVSTIHGGAASIFELTGLTGPQLLQLLSEGGNTAPATLGLAIVRVQ